MWVLLTRSQAEWHRLAGLSCKQELKKIELNRVKKGKRIRTVFASRFTKKKIRTVFASRYSIPTVVLFKKDS
jgi:hypothetical protein